MMVLNINPPCPHYKGLKLLITGTGGNYDKMLITTVEILHNSSHHSGDRRVACCRELAVMVR